MKRAAPRRPAVRRVARPQARPPQEKVSRPVSFVRRHFGWILGFILLAVFVHDVFGARGFLAMRRNQKEVQKLQQEIQKVNEENHQLADRVQGLKTDPKLIERIAREQMGLARPNERVFKLPPKPEPVEEKKQ